jgi:hypothetical protein
MPAKKAAGLITRADTKENRTRRTKGEAALTPKEQLTVVAPARVKGEIARAVWRETISLYDSLDVRIVNLLDVGMLTDYCIASEQLVQIDKLRGAAMANYDKAQLALGRFHANKRYIDPKQLTQAIDRVIGLLEMIIKLDGRADRKRDLLHKFRQSLMLTPRSRGGVTPSEKPEERPQSDMSRIIDGEVKKVKGKK